MHIKKIFIENINGLRGRHCFDLSKFRGLFAITGPTGAGKSTILDAICLALFGQTPRLKTISATQNELMSLGESHCRAAVEFTLAGRSYLASWQQKRSSGKQPFANPVHKLATGAGEIISEKKSDTEKAILELLALDFPQFCQTVLLAQGQFDRFLDASEAERGRIFERISQVSLYRELSRRAFERQRQEQEQLQRLQIQRDSIDLLSDGEQAALEAERQQLIQQSQREAAEQRRQQLYHWRQRRELEQRQVELKDEEERLAAQTAQFFAQPIDRWQRGEAGRPLFLAQQNSQLKLERLELQDKQLAEQERQQQAQLAELEEEWEPLRARLEEERQGLAAWQERQRRREQLKQQRQLLEERQRLLPQAAADAIPDGQAGAELETLLAGSSLEQREGQWRQWQQAQRLAETEAQLATAAQQLAACEAQWRRGQWQRADLGELRRQLRPGEPCPLCGSREHPLEQAAGLPLTDLTNQLHRAQRQLATLEERKRQQREQLAQLNGKFPPAPADIETLWPRCWTLRQRHLAWQHREIAAALAPLWAELANDDGATGAERERHCRELERRWAEWERRQRELEGQGQRLAGQRQQLREQRAELSRERDEQAQHWRDFLREEGWSAAEFQQYLLPEGQWAAIQRQRQQLEEEQRQLARRAADLQAQLELSYGRNLPDEEQCRAELAQLEEAENLRVERLGRIKVLLERQEQQRRRLGERLQQLEAQRRESQRWQRLNGLIGSAKGDELVKFVQGITFDQLLFQANGQLRRMAPRYQLRRRPAALDLEIIDWQQGGQLRSCKNLSGGEKFLVSLALALGLSQLSSEQATLDCLFLDEGFGTLDSENLDLVLEALERLEDGGKLIGVISHIDSLKERISQSINL